MKSHDSNLTKKTTCNADGEQHAQWLKITEKVAFNIASEASYVYNTYIVNSQVTFNCTKNDEKYQTAKISSATF